MAEKTAGSLIRGLFPFEHNTPRRSPRSTWMLRGIESTVELDDHKLRAFLDIGAVLQPSTAFFLPRRIGTAEFNRLSSRLFFTVPEQPDVLRCQVLPDPRGAAKTTMAKVRQLELIHTSPSAVGSRGRGCDLEQLPQQRLPYGIAALASSGGHVFALTVDPGRRPTDSLWVVFRLDVDRERGIVQRHTLVSCELELPSEARRSADRPGFLVRRTRSGSSLIYLATGHGEILYRGEFLPGQKSRLTPHPAAEELCTLLSTSAVVMCRYPPLSAKDAERRRTLLISRETGRIVQLIEKDGSPDELRRVSGGQVPGHEGRIVAAAAMPFSTDDLGLQLQPAGQSRRFAFLAAQPQNRIWTYTEAGEAGVLPLLGGGERPATEGAPKNLLECDVGPIDTLLAIPGRGVLFGHEGGSNWATLLLPPMTWALGLREPPEDLRKTAQRAGHWNLSEDSF